MLMDLFHARLTDAVYLMNLKRELQGDHNMEMFSNAALKMTEILCKEGVAAPETDLDLQEAAQNGGTHRGSRERSRSRSPPRDTKI